MSKPPEKQSERERAKKKAREAARKYRFKLSQRRLEEQLAEVDPAAFRVQYEGTFLSFNGQPVSFSVCPECHGDKKLRVRVGVPTSIKVPRSTLVDCWKCGATGKVAQ